MWLGNYGQEMYLKNFDFNNQSFGCLKFSLQQHMNSNLQVVYICIYIYIYIYAGFHFIIVLGGQEWLQCVRGDVEATF